MVTLEENDGVERESRRMPISLVLDPSPTLRIMQEEIFGPILPVIPYDDVEEVIGHITPVTVRSGCMSLARMSPRSTMSSRIRCRAAPR